MKKNSKTLAIENNIQPNLLRNWEKEFLNSASAVFDDKREKNFKDKLAEERNEKAEYVKQVSQLTMQVDWLKNFVDLTTRLSLFQNLLKTGVCGCIPQNITVIYFHCILLHFGIAKYKRCVKMKACKK